MTKGRRQSGKRGGSGAVPVQSRAPAFESEGAEQQVLGSVQLDMESRWSAVLTVPIPDSGTVFLSAKRHGPVPEGYRGGTDEIDVSFPVEETDAVLTLITSVIAEARRGASACCGTIFGDSVGVRVAPMWAFGTTPRMPTFELRGLLKRGRGSYRSALGYGPRPSTHRC